MYRQLFGGYLKTRANTFNLDFYKAARLARVTLSVCCSHSASPDGTLVSAWFTCSPAMASRRTCWAWHSSLPRACRLQAAFAPSVSVHRHFGLCIFLALSNNPFCAFFHAGVSGNQSCRKEPQVLYHPRVH